MLTWSSWFAEVGRLSTEAGCASDLFSEASAAAVTCAIMKPELSPPCRTRNAGSWLRLSSISIAMRRSLSAPISAMASARLSAAKATGSAWKLPPERTSPSLPNTSGLSETPFASSISVRATSWICCRQAPATCGWQRSEYGSCTRSQFSCDRPMSLSPSTARNAAATAICAGWPRALWMRASKGTRLPSAASTDIAPVMIEPASRSSAANRRLERERGRDLRAVQQREPFLRAELERLDAGGLQRCRALLFLALHAHAALADQREREVRERREVAGGADRALRGHDRMDACVDEREQPLDHDRAHARETAREARGLQHHDQPHGRVGERRADAGRVRAHEVELQRGELVVGDARLRQLAEAGVDAVERFAGGESRAHGGKRRFDRSPPAFGERDGVGAARDAPELRERDAARLQRHRRHQRTDGRSRPCSRAQAIASS